MQRDIVSLPKYWVISLNIFRVTDNVAGPTDWRKEDRTLNLAELLDGVSIERWWASPGPELPRLRLAAAILHEGLDLNGDHYTAVVNYPLRWCNDSRVSLINSLGQAQQLANAQFNAIILTLDSLQAADGRRWAPAAAKVHALLRVRDRITLAMIETLGVTMPMTAAADGRPSAYAQRGRGDCRLRPNPAGGPNALRGSADVNAAYRLYKAVRRIDASQTPMAVWDERGQLLKGQAMADDWARQLNARGIRADLDWPRIRDRYRAVMPKLTDQMRRRMEMAATPPTFGVWKERIR
eukprot:gene6296-1093_t